jgi:hypothetical protein
MKTIPMSILGYSLSFLFGTIIHLFYKDYSIECVLLSSVLVAVIIFVYGTVRNFFQNNVNNKLNKNDLLQRVMEQYKTENEALPIPHISNWLEFDVIKPEKDKLVLITNGNFVEIAYYEDGKIQKPWNFDKYDTETFNAQQNGLKWQYIDLPDC